MGRKLSKSRIWGERGARSWLSCRTEVPCLVFARLCIVNVVVLTQVAKSPCRVPFALNLLVLGRDDVV